MALFQLETIMIVKQKRILCKFFTRKPAVGTGIMYKLKL